MTATAHDNENLIRLLRSPWFRVKDQELVEWVFQKKGSYWEHIKATDHMSIDSLKSSLEKQWKSVTRELQNSSLSLHTEVSELDASLSKLQSTCTYNPLNIYSIGF